jgi:hypothetical protein
MKKIIREKVEVRYTLRLSKNPILALHYKNMYI